MRIWKKTLLIVGCCTLGLFFLSLGSSWLFFSQDARRLESIDANKNSGRIRSLIDETMSDLSSKAADYASWDDAYRYIRDRNPAFIESNFRDLKQSFGNLKINLMGFFDASGKPVWIKSYDYLADKELEIGPEEMEVFSGLKTRFVLTEKNQEDFKGLLQTPHGALLFAVRKLVHTDGSGPIRGLVIVGRMIDAGEIDRISKVINVKFGISSVRNVSEKGGMGSVAYNQLSSGASTYFHRANIGLLQGFLLLNDYAGRPAYLASFEMDRGYNRMAHRMLISMFIGFLVLILFFVFVLLHGLDRLIVRRVEDMAQFLSSISEKQVFSKRLNVHGQDEIADLGSAVNLLLDTVSANNLTIHQQQQQVMLSARLAAIGTLAAGVAHEINNPAAVILGSAVILRKEVQKVGNAEWDDLLGKVQRAVDRISDIVKGLKTFAHSDTETVRDVDIHQVIAETLSMVEVIYKKKGTRIECKLESKSPFILGNKGKLQQILVNMIANAHDAFGGRENDGLICLETEDHDGVVIVRVRDNGVGIKPEHVGKIFDPFFTTKEPGKGTGLGLSISHQIVVSMQGTLHVESKLGVGTTFVMSFPLLKKERGLPGAKLVAVATPRKLKGKVLLVDDEADLRMVLRMELEGLGLEVVEATDGRAALDFAKVEQFDYVLIDVMMPRMTGDIFITELKKLTLPYLASLRVVVMTGGLIGSYTPRQRETIEREAHAELKKPFSENELWAALTDKQS